MIIILALSARIQVIQIATGFNVGLEATRFIHLSVYVPASETINHINQSIIRIRRYYIKHFYSLRIY